MTYFYLYVGVGILLITALAINVSRVRIIEQIGNGDGNNRTLRKAIRAHMNSLEHILPFALIVFALAHMGLSPTLLAILVYGFLAIRLGHSYAMLKSQFKIRQITAGLTYIFQVLGCLAILVLM